MIVVLGSFDGFHRGHALLFRHAAELAAPPGIDWGVVTFDPHPGLFMGELKTTLFTRRERELIRIFLGVPRIVGLRFDDELAHLTPCQFWDFLRESVDVDGVVVGRDFRFGYRRTGDVALLEQYCREADLSFVAVETLMLQEGKKSVKASSSLIRSRVEAGECDLAARVLGYPWFVWAEVVHGFGRGTGLGFPTANLSVPETKLLPADGVYSVAVLVAGSWRGGALSIGRNPTFDDVEGIRAEVFVLDYEGDLYEASLPVLFLARLRGQERFRDGEHLALQIQADVERSRAIFRRALEANPDWMSGFLTGYNEILKKLGYK
ncbi:MAG: riboflavin biosynthesis protein RibF [Synergistaceae bacterium]|jgi:riboflavin kinase/FMN adenylyltransferase|nr:riboflavin biosynthesis protein RibF [Synergistaceae bacterium]